MGDVYKPYGTPELNNQSLRVKTGEATTLNVRFAHPLTPHNALRQLLVFMVGIKRHIPWFIPFFYYMKSESGLILIFPAFAFSTRRNRMETPSGMAGKEKLYSAIHTPPK
jgi:hypothetical protein